MAVVTAVLKDHKILEGAQESVGSGARRLKVVLYVNNGATQVAGGTDTLDVVVDTLLAGIRSGATFTLRDWAVWQGGRNSSDVEYVATGTVSSNTISLTPKTPAAWSSNATIAASALTVPMGILAIVDVT